jgi:hypothetical protein
MGEKKIFTPQGLYHCCQVLKITIVMNNSPKYLIPFITHFCCLEEWSNNPKLLQEIRLSQKYKTTAQEEEPTSSTPVGNV